MTAAPVVHHHREGRGEPLLLLHGIGHRWQAFAPVMGDLARDFDVHACDSPGFGRSAPLPAGVRPDVTAYADAFAGWIAAQGLDRPHVAGNSMGGAIALELARRGVVRSATAISPAGFWTAPERRYCQATLGVLAGLPRALRPAVVAAAGSPVGRTALAAQLFARPWRVPADEFRATLRDGWAAPAFGPALRAFDDYVFARGDELAGTPTTVLWGTRDLLLPYALQAPRARAALPGARHVPLPGLGHVPFTDDPGMCAAAIRRGAGAA
ncbi:alpha/beta fold hydrolase [Patulibacter americanus]|uniref:alpha/beta fold hydrolase n=1 Tax=Patulibacter americanus TaxID=588672 RepID=UPI0003B3B24C|nr:alpha/beta fold hydrolase [Patulibacter americanus]